MHHILYSHIMFYQHIGFYSTSGRQERITMLLCLSLRPHDQLRSI